jgi:hypothetical protein
MARAAGIHRPGGSSARAAYAAVVAFTVLLTAGAVLLGYRAANEPAAPTAATTSLDARKVRPVTSPSTQRAAATTARTSPTRLAVLGPRLLIDTRTALPGGVEVNVSLPELPRDARAVLLEVTLQGAGAPGIVTVRTNVEETAALRLPAAGAKSSATVVALVEGDRAVAVRTQGGGRLVMNLTGVFLPAEKAADGRVVTLPASPVLKLTPAVDGNDAEIKVASIPALKGAGPISAVMLNLDGDVGVNGGFVAMGPSAGKLPQQVFWGATQGADRTRHGFLVVPVADGSLNLTYHAGTQLFVEIVGYVTGRGAPESAAGLVVPVPASGAQSVTVAANGTAAVPVVPPDDVTAIPAERVSAAIVGVLATARQASGVSVRAPGTTPAGGATLSAAGRPRSMLALSGVENGAVSVTSRLGATVVVTPRALVLTG